VTEIALMKAKLEPLRALEQGIVGYVQKEHGPCRLILDDGSVVVVFVTGTNVGWRFECFSLAVEFDSPPDSPVISFAILKENITVSILIREDYHEPHVGDRSQMLGTGPAMVHRAAKPGQVPQHALNSCLVAYGLLISGAERRLAIVADWFPYNIEVTTDESVIETHLDVSDALSVDRYSALYGFS
jgi:hypothetical protein